MHYRAKESRDSAEGYETPIDRAGAQERGDDQEICHECPARRTRNDDATKAPITSKRDPHSERDDECGDILLGEEGERHHHYQQRLFTFYGGVDGNTDEERDKGIGVELVEVAELEHRVQ